MGLFHYLWSRSAASNSGADSNINWAEGMAPSAVNDSGRAMMASLAGYRDDIAGAIVTGGTSTALTVTSYQVFDTLAHMSGHVIAFTPHTTSGASPTLNVDGLGAKALRQFPSVDMPAGVLVQGTPYVALYNNSDSSWYLQNSQVNPYQIPLAGGLDYWGTTTPNSAFAFPAGQAISRTTYSALFAIMGTTHGSGDGSTTFNLPDKTGRVSAMKEASATRLTSTYFGGNSTSMGATGGLESNNVILTHNHGITDPGHGHNISNIPQASSTTLGNVWYFGSVNSGTTSVSTDPNGTTGITINNAGSASAHNIVQPTIVCNYIIRII
jgi:microcystin-dependent protein